MLAMFHISSQVRSLVTGWRRIPAAVRRCREAVPVIIISWMPRKGMTVVWMPTTALASTALASLTSRCRARCRVWLKTSLYCLISPRARLLSPPDDAAAHADRIGDVAEDELDRREAGVELAIEFLPVAAGEKSSSRAVESAWCTQLPMERNSTLP